MSFFYSPNNCHCNNHSKSSQSFSLQPFIILNVMFIVESRIVHFPSHKHSNTQHYSSTSASKLQHTPQCKKKRENLIRCLNIQSSLSLLKPRGSLYGFHTARTHSACLVVEDSDESLPFNQDTGFPDERRHKTRGTGSSVNEP